MPLTIEHLSDDEAREVSEQLSSEPGGAPGVVVSGDTNDTDVYHVIIVIAVLLLLFVIYCIVAALP